jgi:cytoskeletal protein RodZ
MGFPETVKARLSGMGLALVGIVAVALGLAWAFRSCQPDPVPKIPAKTQHSIDSLVITKPAFDSSQHAGQQKVARDTLTAITHKSQATQAEARANFAKITADSLAATAARAKTADSAAAAWKEAYDARTREAEAWHVAAVRNDSAYQAEHAARITLGQLYAADTLRRVAIEHVNTQLQDAIKKLEQPCRVPGTFGKVPCPSRTVTMVVTAVAAGTAGVLAAKH